MAKYYLRIDPVTDTISWSTNSAEFGYKYLEINKTTGAIQWDTFAVTDALTIDSTTDVITWNTSA